MRQRAGGEGLLRTLLPPNRALSGPGALPGAVRELCWLCRALTLLPVVFQLLDSIDSEHYNIQVLNILQSHLEREDLLLRRLAVRSLVTLSGRPEKVGRGSRAR